MSDIKEIFENSEYELVREMKAVAEAAMYDFVGEQQIKESIGIEDDLKDTVLEYAQKYNRAEFFEKIRALGLPRTSPIVEAVLPILKDSLEESKKKFKKGETVVINSVDDDFDGMSGKIHVVGTGKTAGYYTVELENGKVVSYAEHELT